MSGKWTFNELVAKDFDEIARTNIPHYVDVISKSVALALDAYPKRNARVIDVGSALGRTMESFISAGFSDVHGVDNAPAMLANSRIQKNLVLSDSFPASHGPFDVVVANWTLHFITDAHERAAYIKDVFDNMNPGGIFVLTDKTLSTPKDHREYLNFKRRMGVSEEAIAAKTAAIEGVLVTLPVAWYHETLKRTGFGRVEIVDTAWCFNTFLCHR